MNRILVESPTGDCCYAAIQTETGFLFHLCSDLMNGYNPKEFERAVTEPGPRDIVVENARIQSRDLRQLSPLEARFNQRWAFALFLTEGKPLYFRISKKHGVPELKLFFGLHDDEIHLPERPKQPPARVERVRRREKNDWLFTLLYVSAFGLHFLTMIGLLFLPYWLWLFVALTALLSPAILALCFPDRYTLTMGLAESRHLTGRELLPAWVLAFFPFYLALAEPQLITYLSSTAHVMLYVLPMLALSAGVWFLSRERQTRPGMLALVLAAWCFFGCGVGPVLNSADYFHRGPTLTEHRRISAMEVDGRYYVTASSAAGDLRLSVSREYYDTLSVGDRVTVDYYDGALGVPYVAIYEDYGK